MSPSGLCLTHSEADRVISTFLFDPNLKPSPQNLHQGEASGPPGSVSRMTQALSGCGLRSSGMPHEGYADPVMNDGPRFHSDMLVSDLAEHDTQAIEASVISSTPSVTETTDRVTHKTWSTPTEPNGAQGLELPDPNSGTRPTEVQRLAHEGLEAASCQT